MSDSNGIVGIVQKGNDEFACFIILQGKKVKWMSNVKVRSAQKE